ncbi:MAG: protein-tyrosine phosphatase [Marivirga sp.]|jgi:protein-tyrosine phosphatase
MQKILFVCLGNICRSPLAEALFKKKVIQNGLTEYFKIDSCGTSDYHIGELPDDRTIANAKANGLKINHRGRQFTTDDFKKFDKILVMDRSNLENVFSLSTRLSERERVALIRDYEEENSLKGTNVPDPYYGGEKGFQNVYDILERCTGKLLETL